jgi:uncharacterized protein DUF2442
MGTKGMSAEIESRRHYSYALVRCDDDKNGRVPVGFPILRSRSIRAARRYRHLFVLCSAMHLPEIAKFISEMNREHRLRALFVRSDVDSAWLPRVLERAGLRSFRNMLVHSNSSVPNRVLAAWRHNAQAELIADATVAGNRLIVVSCEPKTYELSFDRMPALKKIAPQERRNFEIAEDGSFIRWPAADIHLDLDALRTITDPAWRKRAERIRRTHGREYGKAIAALRKVHSLRQTDIPGVSERQLRRIEESGAVSVHTMEQLARAHGMPLPEYMSELACRLRSALHNNEGSAAAGT